MEKTCKRVAEYYSYLAHSNLLDQAHGYSKGKVAKFRIHQGFHKLLASRPHCNMDIRNVASPSERGKRYLILAQRRW